MLRALDYFRSAGVAPDPRIGEAIELLRPKRQPDGTWLLENTLRRLALQQATSDR